MDIQFLSDPGDNRSSATTGAPNPRLAPNALSLDHRQSPSVATSDIVAIGGVMATEDTTHSSTTKSVEQGGEEEIWGGGVEGIGEDFEMDEKTKALVSEIERSLEDEGGMGGEGLGAEPVMVHIHQHTGGKRRVKFKEGDALTSEFDDTNLWAHDPNETASDMIEAYRRECACVRVKPIVKLLEQLERLEDLTMPIDTLDLKGVRLDNRSCEVLEAVLSRMQMSTLDLERTNLDDEGAIAICEMVEFYGCTSKLVLAGNNRLRPRAWLTIGRTLKKSPFITMINVSYCSLEEQTLTLLLRSVRANCSLQVLKIEGNNLSGKGTFILMAAMKFNENLRELWLASNSLVSEDGQHLGSILRTNHTLRLLDVRDNNLQDAGVRYISAGIAEQQDGLHILNVSSNNISQDGIHHIAAMLPCTRSLRDLNLSNNRCGDTGMYMLKLGLLANKSLNKLNLSNIKMTCEGGIALAEVLAESKNIATVDLKENDLRVAGLMALQLAHRMNHTLLYMETPKSYRVDQRDRPLIKHLLMEIDRYCARNLQEREDRAEAERIHQHEAQHAQQVSSQEPYTTGKSDTSIGEAGSDGKDEETKEVDPSLIGTLDDVYGNEAEGVPSEEDPFKRAPVLDPEHEQTSLKQMEKEMDALVVYSEEDSIPPGGLSEGATSPLDEECTSLDVGTRTLQPANSPHGRQDVLAKPAPHLEGRVTHGRNSVGELLPDVVDSTAEPPRPEVRGHRDSVGPPPDVAVGLMSSPGYPPDVAVGNLQPLDLLDCTEQGQVNEGCIRPVDLTVGLLATGSSSNS